MRQLGEGQGLLQTGQRDWRQLDLRALSLSDMARGRRFGDREWKQYRLRKERLYLKLVIEGERKQDSVDYDFGLLGHLSE